MELEEVKQKSHRKKQSGPKASRKRKKDKEEGIEEQRNPKAFTYKSAVKAERSIRRTLDINEKRNRVPQVDRSPLEPPPFLIAVVGPPKVGKTTLINGLVKYFTSQSITNHKGPITVVSGKHILY